MKTRRADSPGTSPPPPAKPSTAASNTPRAGKNHNLRGPGYIFLDASQDKLSLQTIVNAPQIDTLAIGKATLSPAIRNQISKNYPGLSIDLSHMWGDPIFNLTQLKPEERASFLSDWLFNFSEPNESRPYIEDYFGIDRRLTSLADDNFCNQLSNFQAKSESQREALGMAQVFFGFKEVQPAILYLEGQNGRGKTHLSLGLAKRYVQEGKKVYYISGVEAELARKGLDKVKLSAADVVVFDDLNACSRIKDQVKEVISSCHAGSKRLIITSNNPPEEIKKQLFPEGEQHELEKFNGRFDPYLARQVIETEESHRNDNSFRALFEAQKGLRK